MPSVLVPPESSHRMDGSLEGEDEDDDDDFFLDEENIKVPK